MPSREAVRGTQNSFSRCFRQNINLCSQEQSSLSKRLSSDRILPLLIRVNSWLIRGNSCSKIKISVKICEICVPLIFPLFLLFLRDFEINLWRSVRSVWPLKTFLLFLLFLRDFTRKGCLPRVNELASYTIKYGTLRSKGWCFTP
jgi:hypothetical protein